MVRRGSRFAGEDTHMQWGVLVTQPQRHRTATNALASDGFAYFMPWREQLSVSRGKKRRQRLPYFGRYIFVQIGECWERLLHLRGVSGMLLNPDNLMPFKVDLEQLNEVRAMCDRNGVISEPEIPIRRLSFGDKVFVESGPFANLTGRYDCRVGKHREAAMFEMFGSEQRVLFRRGELKSAAL
jgi:transcription antitermination factor NusG